MSKTEPIIAARGLKKSYNDGSRELNILRGVDLEVRDGECLAIIGASGAGKSTLLHILGTLDRAIVGDVLFRGKNLRSLGGGAIDQIRNQEIGFVFQFYHLMPEFNALENVMIPSLSKGKSRAACSDRATELLTRVGLAERLTHKPGQLSGGEQQRVAIARALFNEPSVLLADEPTGNLDESTGTGITELLLDLNKSENVTLVLVTHDESVASSADRVIRLQDGITQPA